MLATRFGIDGLCPVIGCSETLDVNEIGTAALCPACGHYEGGKISDAPTSQGWPDDVTRQAAIGYAVERANAVGGVFAVWCHPGFNRVYVRPKEEIVEHAHVLAIVGCIMGVVLRADLCRRCFLTTPLTGGFCSPCIKRESRRRP